MFFLWTPCNKSCYFQPDEFVAPTVDTKGTISAEEVNNVKVLPSGTCQGTLLGAPESSCCTVKNVGGVTYTYKGTKDTSGWGCSSNCIYTKEGDPIEYCFKPGGDLESKCQA